MLVTGIKSKPVYAPLQADIRGRYHLMLGHGQGAGALLRVLAEMQSAAPHAVLNTRVLLVADAPTGAASVDTASVGATSVGATSVGASSADYGSSGAARGAAAFENLGVPAVRVFDAAPALLEEFRTVLTQSLMGTRLYVAGPESFIGLALKIALEFNLNKDEIRAEESGTKARRVHCVHCRTATADVHTNIVRCAGCERWLLVRDHYSRRLAAYMGVMVDAEAPGELPAIKEVFR